MQGNVSCVCTHKCAGHYAGFGECWGQDCDCREFRPNSLQVVQWKVTRKTCGMCGHPFRDNTHSSICIPCLADALGLPLAPLHRVDTLGQIGT